MPELGVVKVNIINIGNGSDQGATSDNIAMAGTVSGITSGKTKTDTKYNEEKSNKDIGKNALKGAGGFAIGLGLAGTSQIGTFTGNQALQNKVNMGLELGGYAIAAAVNPAIAIAAVAMKMATTAINNAEKILNDRTTTQLSQARLGAIITGSSRSNIGR